MPWKLEIPVDGDPDMQLYTQFGLLMAVGYTRIVEGDRGPYIELDEDQIQHGSIHIPSHEQWRVGSPTAYYIEHRGGDGAYTKVYEQLRTVEYADYRIGRYYISPFDLETEDGVRCADVT